MLYIKEERPLFPHAILSIPSIPVIQFQSLLLILPQK